MFSRFPTFTAIKSRAVAGAAVLVFAASALAPASAMAAPKEPPAGVPGVGCWVDDNGTYKLVGVGTRIGLFYCGQDGEWHFSWLVNARIGGGQPASGTPVLTSRP
jgi:hypothetical protein